MIQNSGDDPFTMVFRSALRQEGTSHVLLEEIPVGKVKPAQLERSGHGMTEERPLQGGGSALVENDSDPEAYRVPFMVCVKTRLKSGLIR